MANPATTLPTPLEKTSREEAMSKTSFILIQCLTIFSLQQGPPRTYRQTPPRELLDPTLDSDLFDTLIMYTPHFELRQGTNDQWLCLAIAQSGCRDGEPAVASHGVGDSESTAKREAGLNLIHNLQGLGYVI